MVLADVVDDALEFEDAYVDIDTTGGPSNGGDRLRRTAEV